MVLSQNTNCNSVHINRDFSAASLYATLPPALVEGRYLCQSHLYRVMIQNEDQYTAEDGKWATTEKT